MLTYNLYKATTAVTSVTTATTGIDLGDCINYSIQAVFTGSNVVGTFKLQMSDDNATWIDISGKSTSVTSSTSTVLADSGASYRYVRFQWSYGSGTGNLSVFAIVKQNQVYN